VKKVIILLGLLLGAIAVTLGIFLMKTNKKTLNNPSHIIAIYRGQLPCKNCLSLNETLKLLSDKSYQKEDQYVNPNSTSTEKGKWYIVENKINNKRMILYKFISSSGVSFYEIFNNRIELLDRNMNSLGSSLSYSLSKQ